MLGDTAVAVHPEDERYKALIGKKVVLPLVGREIPIVADEYADPEKGSGAVKITPAHDFNDYQVYKRHPEIGLINILDAKAQLNDERAGEISRPRPLRRAQAVVADLEARGLLEKIEPHAHAVPHAAARQRRRRAVAHRPVVRQRRRAGEARDRRGRERRDQVRPEELGEDLLRVDAQHRALVHLAPDLVGPSDPGVVRARRHTICRRPDASRRELRVAT